MSIADDELEGAGQDRDERRSLIAPPGIAREMPAVTLRGLPAPTPAAGSTEDLEAKASAPRFAARPIAQPSPLETRTAADQAELGRLSSTGSGISQIKSPVARGALRGLNIAGEVASAFLPNVGIALKAIPGTEEHHQRLIGQAQGRIGEDLGEAQKEATTGETQARTEQAQATAEKEREETARMGEPKPKEEKYSDYPGWVDIADGTPLLREENSGQVVRASDHKPPTGFKAAALKQEKPDSAQQQLIDAEAAVAGAKSPEEKAAAQVKLDQLNKALADYSRLTQKPEHDLRELLVVPGPDGTQQVIEAKPGMTIAGNAQKPGSSGNASRAEVREHDKAYVQPAETVEKSYQMMNQAYKEFQDARAQGKELPTGAQSMVALSTHLSTTFGNVKGSRVTKDMIQEHLGARSVSDAALVAVQKLTNGDVLSPEQWKAFHDLISQSRKLSWQIAAKEADRKHIPVDFLPQDLKDVSHEPGIDTAPIKYEKGLVRNGYEFQGGDPTDQKNWKKVETKKP